MFSRGVVSPRAPSSGNFARLLVVFLQPMISLLLAEACGPEAKPRPATLVTQ